MHEHQATKNDVISDADVSFKLLLISVPLDKITIQYKYNRILLFIINAYNENMTLGSLESD